MKKKRLTAALTALLTVCSIGSMSVNAVREPGVSSEYELGYIGKYMFTDTGIIYTESEYGELVLKNHLMEDAILIITDSTGLPDWVGDDPDIVNPHYDWEYTTVKEFSNVGGDAALFEECAAYTGQDDVRIFSIKFDKTNSGYEIAPVLRRIECEDSVLAVTTNVAPATYVCECTGAFKFSVADSSELYGTKSGELSPEEWSANFEQVLAEHNPEYFGEDGTFWTVRQKIKDANAALEALGVKDMTAAEAVQARKDAGIPTSYELFEEAYAVAKDIVDNSVDLNGCVPSIVRKKYYFTSVVLIDKNWWEDYGTIGDFDGDDTVDASDASLLLTYAAEYGAGAADVLPAGQNNRADVNADGVVDATDASLILQYAAANGAGSDVSMKDIVVK